MASNIVNLQFRIATKEDAEQIRHLVESAFRTEDSRQDWTGNVELASHFRLSLDEVEAKIANADAVTLMALDSESSALVASIEVSRRNDSGRLSMIAVDDRYQRAGVGRRVLAYAEDYCRQKWAVKKFSLDALSTRKALIAWYMRRGYQQTGETTPFPVEKMPELKLPKDLCFIEMEKEFGQGLDAGTEA